MLYLNSCYIFPEFDSSKIHTVLLLSVSCWWNSDWCPRCCQLSRSLCQLRSRPQEEMCQPSSQSCGRWSTIQMQVKHFYSYILFNILVKNQTIWSPGVRTGILLLSRTRVNSLRPCCLTTTSTPTWPHSSGSSTCTASTKSWVWILADSGWVLWYIFEVLE